MKIEIKGKLPKSDDIDGVPAIFLTSEHNSASKNAEQLDLNAAALSGTSSDFGSRYGGFYESMREFHKKYFFAESFEDVRGISLEISGLHNTYPHCANIIASVFERIDMDYAGREGAGK